jgi:hypothetical protein
MSEAIKIYHPTLLSQPISMKLNLMKSNVSKCFKICFNVLMGWCNPLWCPSQFWQKTLGANSDHQPTVSCQTFAATIRATRSGRVSRQHVRCPVSSLPLCLCRLHVVQRRTAVRRRIALERSVDCAGSHLALVPTLAIHLTLLWCLPWLPSSWRVLP